MEERGRIAGHTLELRDVRHGEILCLTSSAKETQRKMHEIYM